MNHCCRNVLWKQFFFLACAGALLLLVPLSAFGQGQKSEPAKSELLQKIDKFKLELNKNGAALLKEVEDDLQKAQTALDKALKDKLEALKKKDKAGQKQAQEAYDKAMTARHDALAARSELQKLGIHANTKKLSALVKNGDRLGAALTKPTPALAAQLGLKADQGLVVTKVEAGSPAEKAGVKVHDVLVKIAGKDVSGDLGKYKKALADVKADTPFEIVVIRAGKQETISGVTFPAPPAPAVDPDKGSKKGTS
jgi:predicted metalloprotease with PDZ domain